LSKALYGFTLVDGRASLLPGMFARGWPVCCWLLLLAIRRAGHGARARTGVTNPKERTPRPPPAQRHERVGAASPRAARSALVPVPAYPAVVGWAWATAKLRRVLVQEQANNIPCLDRGSRLFLARAATVQNELGIGQLLLQFLPFLDRDRPTDLFLHTVPIPDMIIPAGFKQILLVVVIKTHHLLFSFSRKVRPRVGSREKNTKHLRLEEGKAWTPYTLQTRWI